MTTDRPFEPPTAPTDRPSVGSARRFTLGDLAILIMATGIFFALAHQTWVHHPSNNRDVGWTFYTPNSVLAAYRADRLALMREIAGTGLVVASFTLVALRLRQPRPRLRLVMRQPGFAAVLAASIASGVAFVANGIDQALLMIRVSSWEPALGGDPLPTYRFTAFPHGTTLAGFVAVLASWLVLRWDRRWRAERSWLDQLGRLVGWAWLVLLPLGQLFVEVMSLYD